MRDFLRGVLDFFRHPDRTPPLVTWETTAADALADEVDVLIARKVIDSRSPAADALLDYRHPPRTPRSSRTAQLEAEVERLTLWLKRREEAGETWTTREPLVAVQKDEGYGKPVWKAVPWWKAALDGETLRTSLRND